MLYNTLIHRNLMTDRNFTEELLYTYYEDRERGEDIETIDYRSLICIITELMSRVEKLEKDNELLKSYVWDGNGK